MSSGLFRVIATFEDTDGTLVSGKENTVTGRTDNLTQAFGPFVIEQE